MSRIGISTISLMLVTEFLSIDHFAETMTAVVVEDDTEAGRKKAMFRCEEMVKEAFANIRKDEKSEFQPDGKIIKQSDTLEEYSENREYSVPASRCPLLKTHPQNLSDPRRSNNSPDMFRR